MVFHFCNTFLNLSNVSSLFSRGIIIYSKVLVSQFYHGLTLFPKNSPALWTTFLEAVFKESNPVSNNYFLYFLANDKNPYPLTYFLVLGSIEYRRISIY